jgi:hypothetical protein
MSQSLEEYQVMQVCAIEIRVQTHREVAHGCTTLARVITALE